MLLKIAIILGTRPEIIKMAPLIRELEIREADYFILHTGQHYSYNLDGVFFDHIRRVEWKTRFEFARRKKLPKLLEGFSHTLSKVSKKSPRWSMLVNLDIL